MKPEIKDIAPTEVWSNFVALNAVPRASKKEERIIQFMLDFGKRLGLETIKDEVGNVIIRKPATSQMEGRKTVTLQSHLDMVHQKNTDTAFDFDTQGIQMYIDGDWVRAQGTTLGADNGMGVAAIMAILESKQIQHPPIEALFTIDEETGMTGAMGLKGDILQGEILLNLDTEEDDEIDIGCAGGIDVTASGAYKEISAPKGHSAHRISVTGLNGGHSGMDIHLGLGNANKIMNRLLYNATKSYSVLISEIDGGGLRNAIPRESFATVVVAPHQNSFEADFNVWADDIKKEFENLEPEMNIEVEPIELPGKVMDQEAQAKLLNAIYSLQNGVYRMSATFSDLVETSNNLARVHVNETKIHIGCLTRSSVNSSKIDLANSIKSSFELAGYDVLFSGDYPGWNPNPKSEILEVLTTQYSTLFGEQPKVVACHAGLECGILGRHYPELDMISFGPTIKGAHSPDERVSMVSVQKFWKFLLRILENIPPK